MNSNLRRALVTLVYFYVAQNFSFCQTQFKIEITDSIRIDYIGELQFLHFDKKSDVITAYDRNKDQFLEIDHSGKVNMVKQMVKEGPESYGNSIQGVSFLDNGDIFIEGNKYFVSLNNDWTQKDKKRKTDISFNPLSLFRMNVYPSFRDVNGGYSVLIPAKLMPYSSVTKKDLKFSQVLYSLQVDNFQSSSIIPFSAFNALEREEFLPDFKKPILKLNSQNELLLSFTYSKRIFKFSLVPEIVLFSSNELKGGLFETDRVGISFDSPSVKRRKKLRVLTAQNDKILDFWELRNFLIVKMQKGIPAGEISNLNTESTSSVEKYMRDMKEWSSPKYQIYANEVLLSESLMIDGEVLFSDEDVIYVQKKFKESEEYPYYKIIKYKLSFKP